MVYTVVYTMSRRTIQTAQSPVRGTCFAHEARTHRVSGEKLDSGLGELPHYRDWKDPSGRSVTAAAVQRTQFAHAKP